MVPNSLCRSPKMKILFRYNMIWVDKVIAESIADAEFPANTNMTARELFLDN
jgi:hypothetical protein